MHLDTLFNYLPTAQKRRTVQSQSVKPKQQAQSSKEGQDDEDAQEQQRSDRVRAWGTLGQCLLRVEEIVIKIRDDDEATEEVRCQFEVESAYSR